MFLIDSAAVKHLSSAIRFSSISYDRNNDEITKESKNQLELSANKFIQKTETQSSIFDSLHVFLRNTYPLIFKTLSSKIINNKSLLLQWKGSSKNKKPVILYAHLDVVPAYSENDSSSWLHNPFAGDIDENYIYGRGAIDDKGSAIAIMESVEKLISANFIPSRDVFIAFGHDEEIGGNEGAKLIADELVKKGVHAEFLLDEGGLVAIDMVPFIKTPVALVFASEKGYLTVHLTVKSNGGHSSFPPVDPPIEILSKAIRNIHEHPFEKRISESVTEFMNYAGPEMKLPFKVLFANRWLFSSFILNEYEKIPSANAMIRTTAVTTKISGGSKENVIPSEVKATINLRLLPGDRSEIILIKLNEIIDDSRVILNIENNSDEASEVSSINSEGFNLIKSTIKKVFPDVIVAPSLMIAQTDSRHFRKVTENIYRFLPVRMNNEILESIHGRDERIGIVDFMESIEFYKSLLVGL